MVSTERVIAEQIRMPENEPRNSVPVGIIGTGNVLEQYVRDLKNQSLINIIACADLLPERAQKAKEDFELEFAGTPEEILARDDIEIILNLTNSTAHYDVTKAALEAGKDVHTEKPLATTFQEALKLRNLAKEKGRRLTGAPDTFLGPSVQTAIALINEGAIGEPIRFEASHTGHTTYLWHPNPHGFYKNGVGPVNDIGVYTITDLIAMFGTVEEIQALGSTKETELVAHEGDFAGRVVNVDLDLPLRVAAGFHFKNGVEGTFVVSYEEKEADPHIAVYGSEGVLRIGDPNHFADPVTVSRQEGIHWSELREVPIPHGRGMALIEAELATYLDQEPRANADLLLHTAEICEIMSSMGNIPWTKLQSSPKRPEPFLAP